jgi:hypothetical protein
MGPDRDDMRHARQPGALGGDIAGHVEAIVRAAEREALVAERAIERRRRSAEDEVSRYLAAARLQVDAEAAARAARLETLSGAARRLADQLSDAAAALNAELARGDDELHGALPRTPWPAAPPQEAERFVPREAPAPEPFERDGAPFPPREAPAPEPFPPRGGAPLEAERFAPREAPAPEPELFQRDGAPREAAPFPHEAPAPEQPAREPRPTWARVGERPAQPAPAPTGEITNAARLVAIEMAVGGAPRADVDEHLRSRFGVEDTAPLLDDVFGAESHAASRLAWGEP